MNKRVIISTMLLFFIGIVQLSAQETDKNLILKLLEDQRQAWNRGDLNGYMQGYLKSDSLVFVGKNGPKYGWDLTLANYKKGYPNQSAMGFLIFDILEFRLLSSDHAFVLGGWQLKREEDNPKGFFTLLLKKVEGTWKIIADHSS